MFQMGQEHLKMVKLQEAEKKLMKRENFAAEEDPWLSPERPR